MIYHTTLQHDTLYKKITSLLDILEWKISGRIPEVAEIWKITSEKKRYEVLIPISDHVDDWYPAFEKALKIICDFKNWNYSEVRNHILSNRTSNEVISLRAFGSLCVNNTLPIGYGNDLHINFSKIIKNTAKQYFSKNKLHQSDKKQNNDSVNNFLNNIRLAPSSVGSYLINIEIPSFEEKYFDTESFTGVSNNLQEILNRVIDISENNKYTFVDDKLLNPNFCESLYKLGGLEEDQETEIIFTKFSPNSKRYIKEFKVKLENIHYSKLRIICNYYKNKKLPINKNINGYVVRLDRKIGDSNGFVYVQCRIDEKNVNLKIRLDGDDYQKSITAHQNEIPVSFSCEVLNMSKRWFGDNVNNFKIFFNEELIDI